MSQLNLLNHYDFQVCDNGYSFVTESGNTYIVSFLEYPIIADIYYTELYTFNIDRIDDKNHRNGNNNMVRNTVIYILDLFFQKHNRALITVCDVADGRQKYRKRLFDQWFNEFNNGIIEKIDGEFCVDDDVVTFATLFYRSTDIDAIALANGFRELIELNFYN